LTTATSSETHPILSPRLNRLESAPAAAQAHGLTKVYGEGETRTVALDGVDVAFPKGAFTPIIGPSGSGKSTLMHCMAGLDGATGGTALIGCVHLTTLNDKQLTTLRRDKVGFIFQSCNLIPTLTALENITLPLDLAGRRPDKQWLDSVVAAVGLVLERMKAFDPAVGA
jgi:putative ABC transport system ATP-binding protein